MIWVTAIPTTSNNTAPRITRSARPRCGHVRNNNQLKKSSGTANKTVPSVPPTKMPASIRASITKNGKNAGTRDKAVTAGVLACSMRARIPLDVGPWRGLSAEGRGEAGTMAA